jgi:hypothetical protein
VTLRDLPAKGQEAKTVNIVSTTNVSKARRPRRLPGARPAPNRGQTAAAGCRGISKGRSFDDRGRQQNRPRSPELRDDELTTVNGERPNP